jgi:RES domain-containing protein
MPGDRHRRETAGTHFTGYVGLAYREAKAKYRPRVEGEFDRYLTDTLRGSMRTDANRFNALGEFGAVYVSLDAATPIRELIRSYRLTVDTDSPEDIAADRILLTLDIVLSRVVDLGDGQQCVEWGIARDAVRGNDKAPCQAVAREIRRTHEAIRYPSATGTGENLAIFVDRLGPTSRIVLCDIADVTLGQ